MFAISALAPISLCTNILNPLQLSILPTRLFVSFLVNLVQSLVNLIQPSSVPRSRSSDDGLIMKELVTTSALCASLYLSRNILLSID